MSHLLHQDRGIIVLLILLGGYLRIYGLGEWYWTMDDAVHILNASADTLGGVVRNLQTQDTHPPVYYFILHYMLKLSENDLFLRMSALVPGLVLIPLSYILGRTFSGRYAGLFMAFIATFGYGAILLSQSMRQYPLFVCLVALSFLCVHHYGVTRRVRYLIWYTVISAINIYTHMASVMVIAGIGAVWFFVFLHDRKQCIRWGVAHIFLFIVFLTLGHFIILPQLAQTEYYDDALDTWMKLGFPGMEYWPWWLFNFLAMFHYYSLYGGGVTAAFGAIPLYVLIYVLGCGVIGGHFIAPYAKRISRLWLAVVLVLSGVSLWLSPILEDYYEPLEFVTTSSHTTLPIYALLFGSVVFHFVIFWSVSKGVGFYAPTLASVSRRHYMIQFILFMTMVYCASFLNMNSFSFIYFGLFILGMIAGFMQKSWIFPAVTCVIYAVNIILTMCELYPVRGDRHSMHLYIPFTFMAAAGFQQVVDWLMGEKEKVRSDA